MINYFIFPNPDNKVCPQFVLSLLFLKQTATKTSSATLSVISSTSDGLERKCQPSEKQLCLRRHERGHRSYQVVTATTTSVSLTFEMKRYKAGIVSCFGVASEWKMQSERCLKTVHEQIYHFIWCRESGKCHTHTYRRIHKQPASRNASYLFYSICFDRCPYCNTRFRCVYV